jgi:hypothetical protein
MKKMITFLTATLMLLSLMTFNSCKKDSQTAEYDLSFDISAGQMLKSTEAVPCFEQESDYVKVNISGTEYKLDVFYVDGKPYTKTIKLPEGNYTINEFVMWNDNGTSTNEADDWVMAATPHVGAEFAQFVSNPLTRPFDISQFAKNRFPIEVVCYEEDQYSKFGFTYYTIERVTVIQECFYGDFFIKHSGDYTGSLYMYQAGYPSGNQYYDAPAIFKIEVYRNGVKTGDYNNNAWYGVGSPLCIQYGDRMDVTDNFEFKLFILVKYGNTFTYKYFYSWTTTDDVRLPQGTDGIIDFVLGNGEQMPADVNLPPYLNLPETATINFTFDNFTSCSGYWKLVASNMLPSGSYDISTGQLSGFCGDKDVYLSNGTYNDVHIYSSLTNVGWPTMPSHLTLQAFAKANWLLNNLPNYEMDINNLSSNQGKTIQMALWQILGNGTYTVLVGGDESKSMQMNTDASTHTTFLPMPGGWAAVLMMVNNDPTQYQIIFTIVDP